MNSLQLLKKLLKVDSGPFVRKSPEQMDRTETIEEAKESLREAVALILEDRIEDIKRGLPVDAIQETIAI